MAYTANDWLHDNAVEFEAVVAIAERFPDACLEKMPNGARRWVSKAVVPTSTDVMTDGSEVYFCGYETVKEAKVYMRTWTNAGVALSEFNKRMPHAYKALIDVLIALR